MYSISLPDGSSRSFDHAPSGFDVAKDISSSLAKSALAVVVNGKVQDLDLPVPDKAKLEVVTPNSEEGLEIIRHDAAHLLAQAVKEIWKDEVQVTIGPVIEDGFYYDFATEHSFTEADLAKIEKKMMEIRSRNEKIERKVMTRDEAIEYFTKIGEHYKVEIIKDIPANEELSVYFQGDFGDLCRGPHAPSTGKIKAFKLLKVSGSYWRGDSEKGSLQRIYGTAWANEKDLKDYLHRLEEAEKRDHRKIVKQMGLLHFQQEATGAIFWHAKGWTILQTLTNYMREKQEECGYQEINTPEVMDCTMWEKSGHLATFGENMFSAETRDEKRELAIKPMSCPGAIQVFNQGVVSYRDLPLLLSEFGKVHRYEPSGALHGMFRLRAFTQDDAHIFCTMDQLHEEVTKLCNFTMQVYKDFGFDQVRIKFSDRPEKRVGDEESWNKAEEILEKVLKDMKVEYSINKGEGAFYGPKLEFVLRDAIGRDWQLGTVQVDFNLPVRLNAYYTGSDSKKHHPVMIHRAVFGSLERFMAILIEHYSGNLPLWIAPIQVVVASITQDESDYAKQIFQKLKAKGYRVILDIGNEQISYKVREHSLAKVPIMVILGKNEVQAKNITTRIIGSKGQETIDFDDFLGRLEMTIDSKGFYR